MSRLPATRRSQGGEMAARGGQPLREHPLQRLARDVNTLFDRLWGGSLTPFDPDFQPPRVWDFDVRQGDQGEVVVRAEIPGFDENELDVQINNDVLSIRGEKEQAGDERQEYRSFYRAITLPPGVDPDGVQATYHNGVLELRIPRSEAAQAKRIQIQGHQAAAGQHGQQAAGGRKGQQAASHPAGAGSSQGGSQGQQAGSQAGAAVPEKART